MPPTRFEGKLLKSYYSSYPTIVINCLDLVFTWKIQLCKGRGLDLSKMKIDSVNVLYRLCN